MAERIPTRLSPGEARRFGLVVGLAFLAIAAVLWWRGRVLPVQVTGALGAALMILGLVAPVLLIPVHRVWMGFALILSKVTTPLFMGAVYFLVLTPTGLLRRLSGGRPLRPRPRGESLWVVREGPTPKPADLERQF